jgi:hypothetical protein
MVPSHIFFTPRATGLAVSLTAATVLWLAWILGGGPAGWVYLALVALAILPGIPVAAFLFGGRHAATYLAGAALGYPLTALLLWACLPLRMASPAAFVATWTISTALLWAILWPRRAVRVDLPPWSRRDTLSLALVLLLVPALAGRPFSRLGEQDAEGARLFRAYFTADFLWHMALTAELEKFEWPPRNPYAFEQPLHYYWLHFVPPAVASTVSPAPLPDRIGRLTINAIGTGLIFFSSIFLLAWVSSGGHGPVAGLATGLAVLASSAEGLFVIYDHLRVGAPLNLIRYINVDAATAWFFNAFTIDGLQRALWYNPHHSMACASGLTALTIAAAGRPSFPLPALVVAGLALGLGMMVSPFPAGVIALSFAAGATVRILVARAGVIQVLRLAIAGLPIAAALAWCVFNETVTGAGGDLRFGFYSRSRAMPFGALALAAGPVLVPVIVGLVLGWKKLTHLWPAVAGVVVSLGFIYLVHLQSESIWIGWRAGQVLLVTAPAIGAVGLLELMRRSRAAAWLLILLVFAAGSPTTALDLYNAQDTSNRERGQGFAWTLEVTEDEWEALTWLRERTRPGMVVQMEPTSRARDTWTLIPSFAERRMAAGQPISLIDQPLYKQASDTVRYMYETPSAEEAWGIARHLGINYIYLDRVERERFPEADAKFATHPDFFTRMFGNDEVDIYWVR